MNNKTMLKDVLKEVLWLEFQAGEAPSPRAAVCQLPQGCRADAQLLVVLHDRIHHILNRLQTLNKPICN